MKTTPAPSLPRSPVGGQAITTGNTVEVDAIDDPQTAALRLLVDRNLAHAMADAHLAGRDRHGHALTNQTPRHRVAVRVDLDGTIVADDAAQFAQRSERRLSAERFQPVCLVTREADDRFRLEDGDGAWRLSERSVPADRQYHQSKFHVGSRSAGFRLVAEGREPQPFARRSAPQQAYGSL
ncbi:hypothetical protein QIH95_47620 (plasmid) [Bradyrhizobium japonicum]|nr:hypothetical protein [Bradyrhizobium japonicum]WLB24239.1 hypothetical protein QIH95_47620 [Bradyrhizobium japonicum]